ncbi:MAG: hypothetical protein ACOC6C_05840, partial [Verrucomicrobiota bacterium]
MAADFLPPYLETINIIAIILNANWNKKAGRKLRRYVESHDHAIRTKAEIMVDHFHEQVIA